MEQGSSVSRRICDGKGKSTYRGKCFLSMGYEKDVSSSFVYEFEPSHK